VFVLGGCLCTDTYHCQVVDASTDKEVAADVVYEGSHNQSGLADATEECEEEWSEKGIEADCECHGEEDGFSPAG